MHLDKNDVKALRENRQMLRGNNKCEQFPFSRSISSDLHRTLILITTQVVKCVSLEGEIVSSTMVPGEGTNLIDHNHQILVMLENY